MFVIFVIDFFDVNLFLVDVDIVMLGILFLVLFNLWFDIVFRVFIRLVDFLVELYNSDVVISLILVGCVFIIRLRYLDDIVIFDVLVFVIGCSLV